MAKLGSAGNPLRVCVHHKRRANEIMALCNQRGWKVSIHIDHTKPEDLRDLQRMSRKQTGKTVAPRPGDAPRKRGRNDYCPCGSGRKYKDCCWDRDQAAAQNP